MTLTSSRSWFNDFWLRVGHFLGDVWLRVGHLTRIWLQVIWFYARLYFLSRKVTQFIFALDRTTSGWEFVKANLWVSIPFKLLHNTLLPWPLTSSRSWFNDFWLCVGRFLGDFWLWVGHLTRIWLWVIWFYVCLYFLSRKVTQFIFTLDQTTFGWEFVNANLWV